MSTRTPRRALSIAAVSAYALVFAYVYNPRFGLLNQTLGLIGLDRGQDWLYQSSTALMAVMATYVFVLGFVVILVRSRGCARRSARRSR